MLGKIRSATDEVSEVYAQEYSELYRIATTGRRRKIRCTFSAGSVICAHCTERGTRCIDQRDADVACSPRSRQEAPGSSSPRPVSKPRGTRKTSGLPTTRDEPSFSDIESPIQDTDQNPPLVSVLGSITISDTHSHNVVLDSSSKLQPYQGSVRGSLLAILPSPKEVVATLTSNAYWWDSFRKKTRAISRTHAFEPLGSFATRVIGKGSAAELATVVIGYERSLDSDYGRLPVVERLVMSEFELICTIEGLECLILLAKTYTDIGKPKRAWFTWRKGLAAAQFLGLHRLRPESPAVHQRIWWAIYHGDRFASLLLGLPHGCNDTNLELPLFSKIESGNIEDWIKHFVFRTSVIAGQVIDHNTTPSKLSFATAMKLEEQMNDMATSAPPNWWDISDALSQEKPELDALLDKLLIQVFFLHTHMYLHLPFLTTTAQSERILISSQRCFDTSRQLLERYLLLRKPLQNGLSLFECKTTDFVGFTAAVVLVITRQWRATRNLLSDGELVSAWKLVVEAEAKFQELHLINGCNVAAQCYALLHQLLHPAKEEKISIPYFGKVVLHYQGDGPSPVESDTAGWDTEFNNFLTSGLGCEIDFASIYKPMDLVQVHEAGVCNSGLDVSCLDFNSLDWDLDQDWSYIV